MLTLAPLFAFGFSNLAMLGWMAAAAAPLLIHLWSRHRFREAPWAAMQFLLAAMRKNARRMQLQQWLLLAVRTLLIVLVVLAVAEPYGEQLVAGSSSGPVHKVLVLDGSYSMAYRGTSATNFEQAKKLAANLVRDSRSGDTFTVILMSRPARTIAGRETVDHSAIASQIASLPQTHTGADLAAALTRVDESLTAQQKANAAARQEVYFFTDLQHTTWQRAEASPPPPPPKSEIRIPQSEIESNNQNTSNGLEPLIASLSHRAALTVIDVGQPRASNLAVKSLTTPEPFVTIDRNIAFEATVHQFGQEPQQCVVELVVDDVPVADQTVDIPAGGEAAVRFTHRFRSPGNHSVAVRATGDRLPIDNARWLVLPAREEIRVLLVAGREGAADHLADALNPNPAASSAIRPVIVSEGDLAELNLSEYDSVFLCNVAQFTPSEAQRLHNYAAAGGGIVFFLGDRVIPDAYNRLSDFGLRISDSQTNNPQSEIRNRKSAPLLPARIGQLIVKPQFGLDPLDYRHPIVAPFRGRERAGLLTTPVARYYQLAILQKDHGVEIAANTRDGNPFIVAAPLGRGRLIVVATDGSLTSIDPATGEPWTTWPTWPSFLPVVREMLAYAAGGQDANWQQPVGTSIGGPLDDVAPSAAGPSHLQINRPDGRAAPVNVQPSNGARHWSYNATDLSGIYSLRGASQDEVQQFAVNVDTAESDLAKADLQQLPPQLVVRDTWQDASGTQTASVLTHAGWNEQLLWFALALLFVESLLAWRFGRGAA